MARIDAIKQKMLDQDYEAFLVTDMKNIYYLTGFSGTAGTILLTKDAYYFMTDDRYIEFARAVVKDMEIIQTRDAFSEVGKLMRHYHNLAFEDSVDFATYAAIKEQTAAKLIATTNFFQEIRQIKEQEEIETIRKACEISDKAFNAVLKFIEPGKEEIEVANFLDFKMRELGASGVSFDTIVASGKRSSLPHGLASHKVIDFGDPVTMDFGCFYNHYASDITRTIFVGQADPQMAQVYETVLSANQALIDQAKAGLSYADFDKIPRDIITEAGFGENFGHGIGHGFGLDIHEIPLPNSRGESIHANSKMFLQENMLITDEPGIYLPGIGGVRIEDDLLIKKDGCEVLTKAAKNLIII